MITFEKLSSFFPTFQKTGYNVYYTGMNYNLNGPGFCQLEITEEEYKRYMVEKTMPITSCVPGVFIYLDEDGLYHNMRGIAIRTKSGYERYFIHGKGMEKEEWVVSLRKKIVFSPVMIKTIKRILYIPEIYGNVYYECKGDFISLIQKI